MGPSPLWSQSIQNCVRQINCFRPFFGRKWSLTAKPSTFDPIVLYIIGKLCIWQIRNAGGKSIFDILWSARISVTHPDRFVTLIWFFVLDKWFDCHSHSSPITFCMPNCPLWSVRAVGMMKLVPRHWTWGMQAPRSDVLTNENSPTWCINQIHKS